MGRAGKSISRDVLFFYNSNIHWVPSYVFNNYSAQMKRSPQRALRILQVSAYAMDRFGGVQSHVRALTDALIEIGHDVKIVSPGSQSADGQTTALGIALPISLAGTKFEISYARHKQIQKFFNEINQWKPDIVHIHGLWVPFLPWQIFRNVRAARVVTFHDTPPPGTLGSILRMFFGVLGKIILNNTDAAIAVSELPMLHLRPSRWGIKPVVIPPMVNLSPFLGIRKADLKELETVLFWGRFEDRKGVDVLLKAITHIESGDVAMPAHIPRIRFLLAGKGAERAAKYSGLKACLKIHTEFREAPTQKELLELLKSARMVVLPSLYGESFGIVIVEAMASGTPIIVADNPGYRSVLQKDFAHTLIPPGDSMALAHKIIENFNHHIEQGKQAKAGRNFCSQFNARTNIGAFLKVYYSAIDHSSSSNSLRDPK